MEGVADHIHHPFVRNFSSPSLMCKKSSNRVKGEIQLSNERNQKTTQEYAKDDRLELHFPKN
jgi:hypothetical protein